MVYTGYLDDSADAGQRIVHVSAGFVATIREWCDFRSAWNRCLKKSGIAYYSTKEMKRLEGQFARFKADAYPPPTGMEAALSIRDELERVIEAHPRLLGFGVAFSVKDYERVKNNPEADGGFIGSAYNRAFESVMILSAEHIRSKRGKNVITFVHDETSPELNLPGLYKNVRIKNPRMMSSAVGFTCQDDRLHAPLQAADMMANSLMNDMQEWLDSARNQPFRPRRLAKNIRNLSYWNERFMLQVLRGNPGLTKRAFDAKHGQQG